MACMDMGHADDGAVALVVNDARVDGVPGRACGDGALALRVLGFAPARQWHARTATGWGQRGDSEAARRGEACGDGARGKSMLYADETGRLASTVTIV